MDEVLATLITRQERDAVMAPIAQALALPACAYTDEAWYRLEIERIFNPSWFAVRFAAEIPNSGDALPFELFDMPLVAIRGDDARVRVFHNIVPYDGCLAVMSAAQSLTEIDTYYHGWRFDLKGSLIAAPYWNSKPDCGPEGLGGREGDLVEIRSEERLGVIFINLDGNAGPIDDWLSPWRALVEEEYAIDRLVPACDADGVPLIEHRTVAANWKTYQENASINLLHESFTHALYRQSSEVPRVSADGTPRFVLTTEGPLMAFAHNKEMTGQTYAPPILPTPGHDPDVTPDWGFFTTLYPNVNIPVLDAFIKINIAIPTASGATELQHLRFYAPEAVGDRRFFDMETAIQRSFEIVHEEDRIAIEAVQSARRSPVWQQHYYAPFWDTLHQHFNRLVMKDMEKPAADPDRLHGR